MSTPSVYQRVLGRRFAHLDPGLHAYFGPVPAGMAGVGRGVYHVAGSRVALLRPVFAWMAWRGILFPDFGHDVPFTVVNITAADGELRATRMFEFAHRTRFTRDRMAVDAGSLVDRLGRRSGLEVVMTADIDDGGLRLTSGRLALHLLRVRIPLPQWARVTVEERWADERQHVDVRIRMPLLGEIFRYAGSFVFEHVPLADLERMPR